MVILNPSRRVRVLWAASHVALLVLLAGPANSETWLPIADVTFTALVQPRLMVNLSQPASGGPLFETPWSGATNAGHTVANAFSLARLEAGVGSHLLWPGWSLRLNAALSDSDVSLLEAYLRYVVNPVLRLQAGRMPTVFGLEPKTPYQARDTIEPALIYGLGNFAWQDALGLFLVPERSDGVRLDAAWPAGFATLAPFVSAAWVSGGGRNIAPGFLSQVQIRAGLSSRLEMAPLRHELTVAVSGLWGWHALEPAVGAYWPVGLSGDLSASPELAVMADPLPAAARVRTLGLDFTFRVNEWLFKGEWVTRHFAGKESDGYYVTGLYPLPTLFGADWQAVVRWEEANMGYADGVHAPADRYQTMTGGVNGRLGAHWRLQINYLRLFRNLSQNRFPGSDVLLTQLQFHY